MSRSKAVVKNKIEQRVRCSCGFQTGWFDQGDAGHIALHHSVECDGEVEYKRRKKTGTNYSDFHFDPHYIRSICPHCDDGKDYECQYCGKGFKRNKSRKDHELVCMGI